MIKWKRNVLWYWVNCSNFQLCHLLAVHVWVSSLPSLNLPSVPQNERFASSYLKFSAFKCVIPGVSTVQSNSVAQSCPAVCDPMNRSRPGLPVHHQLPEFAQTHVHRVSDAIQPSHPLSSPSPPAFNLSQHQGLFQ